VAVEPPRASRFRVVTQVRRVRYRLGGLTPDPSAWLARLRFLLPEQLDWRALAWSIVPGLGHLRTDRPRLGWPLLTIWLVCVALTVLSVATVWNWLFYTAMVATHAVAVLSVFAACLAFERFIWRVLFGTLVFFCVQLAVYTPAVWLGTRILLPITIDYRFERSEYLSPRDGLLVAGPWLRASEFQRGDVVLYELRSAGSGEYIVHAGYSIDRVVGCPGDHVRIANGELMVNDSVPPRSQQPLGSVRIADGFDVHLGPREYAVLPTSLQLRSNLPPPRLRAVLRTVMFHTSVVNEEDITGKVLWRLRPLTRFGPLR
jgi:hypothetical protein